MNKGEVIYFGRIIVLWEYVEVYMRGLGFYDEYFKLMGNLKDKPDLATPYKIFEKYNSEWERV